MPPLFSLVEEPESHLVPLSMDLDNTEWEDIQIATPTYVLFPGGDPFGDEIPPGFAPIIRPGDSGSGWTTITVR